MFGRTLLLLLAVAVFSFAPQVDLTAQTTYTSIATGNWTSASTWDAAGVPPNPLPAGDQVVLGGNFRVTLDFNQVNNGEILIDDNGSLVLVSGAVLTNASTGMVRANSDASTVIDPQTGSIIDNSGYFGVGVGGVTTSPALRIKGGTIINRATGTFESDENLLVFSLGGGTITNEAGGLFTTSGNTQFSLGSDLGAADVVRINNSGTMRLDGGNFLNVRAPFMDFVFNNFAGGVLEMNEGNGFSSISASGPGVFENQGSFLSNSNRFDLGSETVIRSTNGGLFRHTDGFLRGTGTIEQAVFTNEADEIFSNGFYPGFGGDMTDPTFNIVGNYVGAGTLLYDMDLRGDNSFKLDVIGTANLTGERLRIQSYSGPIPAIGETYNIVTAAGGVTGPFTEVRSLPDIGADRELKVVYTPNTIFLEVVSTTPACEITNVQVTNTRCGDNDVDVDQTFVDISFDVSGGSGDYQVLVYRDGEIDTANDLPPGETTDGTVNTSGQLTFASAEPGEVVEIEIVDDGSQGECRSERIQVPVLECPPCELRCEPNVTVELDGSGQATVTAMDLAMSTCDDMDDITASQTDFTCADIGSVSVTVVQRNVTVQNNDFATRNLSSWTEGGTGRWIVGGPGGNDEFASVQGDNFSNNTLSQTLTGLTVGETYTVSFLAGGNDVRPGSTTTLSVEVDGTEIFSQTADFFDANDGTGSAYSFVSTPFTATFTATATSATLTFRAVVEANSFDDVQIDDITVEGASCQSTVVVADNTAPVARCQNIDVILDGDGNGTAFPDDVDNGSSDACGINNVVFTSNPADENTQFIELPYDCDDVGPNLVTLLVFDNNGNTSSCTATVNVIDDTTPVLDCQGAVTVFIGEDGGLLLDENTIFDQQRDMVLLANDAPLNSIEDNCLSNLSGPFTMGGPNNRMFDCADVGQTFPRRMVYNNRNGGGEVVGCDYTVTVVDPSVPVLVCTEEPVIVELDDDGNLAAGDNTVWDDELQKYLLANDAALISITDDNCGLTYLSGPFTMGGPDARMFDCSDVSPEEPIMRTLVYNNPNLPGPNKMVVSCDYTVIVEDNIDPVPTCPISITVNNDAGVCGAVVFFDFSSNDNCPGETASAVPGNGSFFAVGTTSVTVTATDASGNTGTCSFSVTVNDTEDPTALCQDVTVQLNASGNGSTTADAVDNGSSDNCGIKSLALDITDFTCDDVGEVDVVLTVTDNNDNTSTCDATVTVEDKVDPVITLIEPMPRTIVLDDEGLFTLPVSALATAADACGVESLTAVRTGLDQSLEITEEGTILNFSL
jgi:hypothetical protein